MIDRATLSPLDAWLLDTACSNAAKRRARNRARGLCINENKRGEHGPATHGVRCQRCHEQHRRSR